MMNKKGFTLIELIIVVAIISILLVIAGISGKAWLDRYRVESEIRTLAMDLMNAQASAMQRKRTYFAVFSPTPTATQYTVYEDTNPGPDGNGTFEPADRQVLQTSFKPAYALTIPGVATPSINFDPNGIVSMSPGWEPEQTIRAAVSFGAAYDCITISATKIRTGAWNGATSNCDVQ